MKRLSLLLICSALILLSSCAEPYQLMGTTNVHGLEGKTLFLKVFADSDLVKIDSCCVQHGKFAFRGTMDSTVMANLFVEEQSVMPIVLEGGDLAVRIDEATQRMSGSPLNDSLYSFIQRKTQIDNQISELSQKEGRMVMDGMDFEEVVARLSAEYARLCVMSDDLITSFIKRNMTNVLGSGIFMIMTSAYAYPIITPQIEEILTTATPKFLAHPYVRQYLRAARENMEVYGR